MLRRRFESIAEPPAGCPAGDADVLQNDLPFENNKGMMGASTVPEEYICKNRVPQADGKTTVPALEEGVPQLLREYTQRAPGVKIDYICSRPSGKDW